MFRKLFGLFAPAAAIAGAAPVSEWRDDTLLRTMAAEAESGFCKWVAACDLLELFTKIDAYNDGRPQGRRIAVEMHEELGEWLNALRADGLHDNARLVSMLPKGSLTLNDEMTMRLLGPQDFGGLRLRMGDHTLRAHYCANAINTFLEVEVGPNTWRQIGFGLGTEDLFIPAAKPIGAPARLLPRG